MTLQELASRVAELLTTCDATTSVAACSDVLATIDLVELNVGSTKKVVVVQKDV
jgi:hypothetical protein